MRLVFSKWSVVPVQMLYYNGTCGRPHLDGSRAVWNRGRERSKIPGSAGAERVGTWLPNQSSATPLSANYYLALCSKDSASSKYKGDNTYMDECQSI